PTERTGESRNHRPDLGRLRPACSPVKQVYAFPPHDSYLSRKGIANVRISGISLPAPSAAGRRLPQRDEVKQAGPMLPGKEATAEAMPTATENPSDGFFSRLTLPASVDDEVRPGLFG